MVVELISGAIALGAVVVAAHARRHCVRLQRELVAAREIFELANDPVLVADILDGRVLEVNTAACALLDYPRDDLLRRTLPELHPAEVRAESAALVADVWEKKGLVYRLPFVSSGGESVAVEVSAKVFEFRGQPCMLIVARDIRERLRLESRLVQSEKMASLGQLVAGVAHEINTPVGAIHANAATCQNALSIIAACFEDEAMRPVLAGRKKLERSIQILAQGNESNRVASERIVATVRALKNFARLDESDKQRADLHQGLDNTLLLLVHQLKRGVEVVKKYGEVPKIECLPNQLNQVFMNILVNAIQALDGQGTITIETQLEGEEVVLTFTDTGKGIADADLPRIFDPGFTRKGVGVGTGLGLSISYQIIEQHNGHISAESELGKGTTLTVRLPA